LWVNIRMKMQRPSLKLFWLHCQLPRLVCVVEVQNGGAVITLTCHGEQCTHKKIWDTSENVTAQSAGVWFSCVFQTDQGLLRHIPGLCITVMNHIHSRRPVNHEASRTQAANLLLSF